MPLAPTADPFESAWYFLMQAEGAGKYVDNPADPGGPTRWGVSLKTLREVRNNTRLEAQDVAMMTEAEAKQICLKNYYNPLGLAGCRNVPAAVCILDQGFNRGNTLVNRLVQTVLIEVLGHVSLLTPDGLNVLATGDPSKNRRFLLKFIVGSQKAYFQRVQEYPHLAQFLPGWINRTQALIGVVLAYCP